MRGCCAAMVIALLALCSLGASAETADRGAAVAAAEAAARGVMADFLEAFNARDEEAWADTLVFPHVRLASQTVTVYPDRAAFVAAMDLEAFARNNDWDYSSWDDMRVVQASPDKVHIAVKFSRFRPDGSLIASFDSLYVIERVDGHWGVRARSSFAP